MKSLIRWSIRNTPAMNTLLLAVLLVGGFSLWGLRREVFPEFDLDMILVSVPYPGASPEEVEEGICLKIEEAVRSIDGIKKQTTVAAEGAGSVVLELQTSADPQKVLSEVRSEVDRISTFPLLAEDAEVQAVTFRESAITVGVVGPETEGLAQELRLRDMAERIREEMIQLPTVSQATISGAKNYQIDIEIPEATLREYQLSMSQVAQIIARENLELPGGTIKTRSQDILVKGDNKYVVGERIAKLPLITQPDGAVLTVGDIGVVKDGFDDTTSQLRVNNRPTQVISIERTADEDLLAITEEVRDYVASKKAELPPGYSLEIWGDQSVDVRDRLELLSRNGMRWCWWCWHCS